jgi:DnaJ-class molecular chaperone
MTPEEGDGIDQQAEASHGSQECMPCRGTGHVISNLGGTASKVTCPWCEGDGIRRHGIDAQAHWLSGAGAAPPADAEEAA